MTGPIHQFDEGYGAAVPAGPASVVRPLRQREAGEPPRVCVLYNPRSHRNKGQDLLPAELPNVCIGLPHGRHRIAEVLREFAEQGCDYLVINGGDGTVRDVLTCGMEVFGNDWPEIAVLPKGKTNALNVDLGAPKGWNLADAIEAHATGKRLVRRPLEISRADGSGSVVRGFIMGGGAFSRGVRAGQDAHRMGAFNSLAVGATAAWGVAQVLFGTDANPWRRGAKMDITLLPEGEALPHSRYGEPDRRVFMLASTLERFPAGMQLFGETRPGLKLFVIDHPRRRVMALAPAVLYGFRPQWLVESGLFQLSTEAFEIDIGEPFILDGEAFAEGRYRVAQGAPLTFVVP